MKNKIILYFGLFISLLFIGVILQASSKGRDTIIWQVLAGGGNTSTANNTILSSTLGQTAVGEAESDGNYLSQGFHQNFESPADCQLSIMHVPGPKDGSIGVPVLACNVSDIAGIEFHVSNDSDIVRPDSMGSIYLSAATVGSLADRINIIWEDFMNPVSFVEGDTVLILWYTCIGDTGETSPLLWTGNNEMVDSNGDPIPGISYAAGSITIRELNHHIAGHISYYNMSKMVPGVEINITPAVSPIQVTDISGYYIFDTLATDTYTMGATRTENDPGVSVADIIKIRRHLAYLEVFDTPYKLVASDVNNSTTVSVADVVKLRRYLAQIEPLESGNWTFIDSAYAITNSNWSTAPQTIAVSLSDHDINNCSFVGVRMGDVNDTWSPVKAAKPSSSIAKSVLLKDTYGVTGDDISIPLLVEANTEIAGIELHLKYDSENLEYIKTESELLGELTVNVNDDGIHIVWEDINNTVQTKNDMPIVQIHFIIKDDFESESAVEIIDAEIVNILGEPYSLNLVNGKIIKGSLSTVLPKEYKLKQNVPNPFNPVTDIRFSLPEACNVRLEIFNIIGQRIETMINDRLEAGHHSCSWDASNYASGIYFTRLRAGKFIDTKKMILLK